MKIKDLTVLAECVDIRTGKRFLRGDTFEPVPTAEQAARLVAAKCLPPGAIKLAEDADAKATKAADDAARVAEKIEAKRQSILAAEGTHARAEVALDQAKAALASANEAGKAEAAAKVAEAETAVAEAGADLERLKK